MTLRNEDEMRWFVTYAGKVDKKHVQFGPLPTQEMAGQIRYAIEALEGHQRLWIVRDDDHPVAYERDLTTPHAKVFPCGTLTPADAVPG